MGRYDSLNRPVVSAMQGADGSFDLELLACDSDAVWQVAASTLFSLIGYDSRGNQTLSIDPKGNSTITIYDGVSRPTQLQEQLRVDGQGAAAPAAGQTFLPFSDGAVVTQTDYDGNGRVTRLVDDNGNQTLYQYDSLDRETQMEFMDGSTRDYVYNKASNVTQYTDENGSVLDNTYDPLGRKTQCDVTQATGVIGTTQQKFEYDGLSRLTFCRDTVSASSADVNLQYDSLSRVLEDSQVNGGNTRNATNEEFTSFPVTQAAFPDGRQITHVYDELYRRTLVEETSGGADIAAWEYFGPARTAELTLGNGLICSHLNNARTHSAVQESVSNPAWGDDASDRLGYDGVGRMITKRYLSGGINGTTHAYNDATAVVGQTTAYDKASNKLYERALHAESRSSLYEPFDSDNRPQGGHDSLNRLRQYQRGVLASTGGSGNAGGGSISTAISLSGTDESRDYDLDGLGNWRRTTFDPVGGSETTQVRQHNSLNQLTRLDSDDLAYDANGNLTEDDLRTYQWDAFNRLKQISKTPSSPVVIGEYHYDALGRRMQKVVTNGGLSGTIPNNTTDYLYHNGGYQCCEERDDLNSVTKQYVWGGYIDELLQMKTAVTINGNAAGDYYPLSDTLYRTAALTNSSGTLAETYDTDPYGNTLIFTAAGTGGDWWADDATQGDNPTCDFIFTGRRYDSESEIYFYRARYYVPELGRFVSRDSIGMPSSDGVSYYQFVASRPDSSLDPAGLQSIGPKDLPYGATRARVKLPGQKNETVGIFRTPVAPLSTVVDCECDVEAIYAQSKKRIKTFTYKEGELRFDSERPVVTQKIDFELANAREVAIKLGGRPKHGSPALRSAPLFHFTQRFYAPLTQEDFQTWRKGGLNRFACRRTFDLLRVEIDGVIHEKELAKPIQAEGFIIDKKCFTQEVQPSIVEIRDFVREVKPECLNEVKQKPGFKSYGKMPK